MVRETKNGKAFEELREKLSQVDRVGMPAADCVPSSRCLLADCVGIVTEGNLAGMNPLSPVLRRRFEWLVLQTLRWTRADGSAVFVRKTKKRLPYVEPGDFLPLMETALRLDEDPNDSLVAATLLGPLAKANKIPFHTESVDDARLPQPSFFSEDASLAAVCAGWNPDEPALFLRAGTTETEPEIAMEMELANAETTLLAGPWRATIVVDGVALEPSGPWVPSCEEQRDEYTCYEWALPLTNDYTLERTVVMLPGEKLLLLADSLLDKSGRARESEIVYESGMPLADKTGVSTKRDARELGLVRKAAADKRALNRPFVQLFPLTMSEWRRTGEVETFAAKKRELVTRLVGHGGNLYAPILIDLDESRCLAPVTWRRLTVATEGSKVPDDVAVACRVQLGVKQYLIYRNFKGETPRSVLGHHLIADLLVAKFDPDRGVEPLVELENVEENTGAT